MKNVNVDLAMTWFHQHNMQHKERALLLKNYTSVEEIRDVEFC